MDNYYSFLTIIDSIFTTFHKSPEIIPPSNTALLMVRTSRVRHELQHLTNTGCDPSIHIHRILS